MPPAKKTKLVAEFGDFQTPTELAEEVCKLVRGRIGQPAVVIEPTCGIGTFLLASLKVFPRVLKAIGIEINPEYAAEANRRLGESGYSRIASVVQADFFKTDWATIFDNQSNPILVIGNPPWVTNAELGRLGSTNLPNKSNFQQHNGLDAITGKSNFDISEWMLIKLLESLNGRGAVLAMLCKTAVARKALCHAWKSKIGLKRAALYHIDTMAFFNSSVDACLLICELSPLGHSLTCEVFQRLGERKPISAFGYEDDLLLANVDAYRELKRFQGEDSHRWRSGVKHDCSKVMELTRDNGKYRNGLGELVALEDSYLYPALKSSDLANGKVQDPKRWMLVTQRLIGEDTRKIKDEAPKTWDYLVKHADLLDRRASSIYKDRPRFSVFGVGDYTFSPWKVAISGFYKTLVFSVLAPHEGKPIVVDDTSYFLPCQSRDDAFRLAGLLKSETARRFLSAFIFWDAKRPITVSILSKLNLTALGGAPTTHE